MTEEQYNELVEALTLLLVPLREGEAPDEQAFEHVREALHRLRDELAGATSISKNLARILVDVHPQLMAVCAVQDASHAAVIEDWAVDITDLIGELLA